MGALAGLVAFTLLRLIGLITNVAYFGRWSATLAAPSGHGWGMVAIPVAGGLAVGLMARYGTDKIRGHGIPEAIESILERKSRMEPRVALFKPLASAITIGTGGPFGAEGPIIMTGGAVASLIAQWLPMTAAERRTLLVAGAAGGMAATFGAPIASVLLAVELLLFEWKPRSLVPVAVASITAYGVRVLLLGSAAIFQSPATVPPHVAWLLPAAALGAVAGLASGAITKSVYLVEDWYRRLPIHWMWWPAIGGVFVGVGGLLVPQALGVGYPTIRELDAGHVLVGFAVALLAAKFLMWVLSLSSGTSGGVLAPLLLMGGALGTALAPALPGPTALWATVGMAALLAATMRAPFTATIFAMETTHDWNAITPVFLASVVGMLVTVLWVRRSILTEKVARRGTHVAREYAVDGLEGVPIRRMMTPRTNLAVVAETTRLADARALRSPAGSGCSPELVVVVDSAGAPVGTWRPPASAAAPGDEGHMTVADVMTPATTIPLEGRARTATVVMGRTGSHVLCVVHPDGRLAGIVTPAHFVAVWAEKVADEEQRERGIGQPIAVDPPARA